jgi:hypothetical protein
LGQQKVNHFVRNAPFGILALSQHGASKVQVHTAAPTKKADIKVEGIFIVKIYSQVQVLVNPSLGLCLEQFCLMHDFSVAAIRRFAGKIGITPGIVAARLQHERKTPFSRGESTEAPIQFGRF